MIDNINSIIAYWPSPPFWWKTKEREREIATTQRRWSHKDQNFILWRFRIQMDNSRNKKNSKRESGREKIVGGKALIVIVIVSGTLVYYHCAYRDASLLSLLSDVLIVLLCSLAILGLLFRQLTIQYRNSFSFNSIL